MRPSVSPFSVRCARLSFSLSLSAFLLCAANSILSPVVRRPSSFVICFTKCTLCTTRHSHRHHVCSWGLWGVIVEYNILTASYTHFNCERKSLALTSPFHRCPILLWHSVNRIHTMNGTNSIGCNKNELVSYITFVSRRDVFSLFVRFGCCCCCCWPKWKWCRQPLKPGINSVFFFIVFYYFLCSKFGVRSIFDSSPPSALPSFCLCWTCLFSPSPSPSLFSYRSFSRFFGNSLFSISFLFVLEFFCAVLVRRHHYNDNCQHSSHSFHIIPRSAPPYGISIFHAHYLSTQQQTHENTFLLLPLLLLMVLPSKIVVVCFHLLFLFTK